MTDFLSVLWTILSFVLGMAWSLVWFVLRDLLSTLTWIGIFVWIGFALRYRSFSQGSLAMLRYGRYGVVYLWRWVRGRSGEGLQKLAPITKIIKEKEIRERVPLGYISFSEQLNVLLVILMVIIAHAHA